MDRRQFILGLGAGMVLPSIYERLYSFVENHGEPLLTPPKKLSETMYAVAGWAADGWQLNLGDINAEPPAMTVGEFRRRYGSAHLILHGLAARDTHPDTLLSSWDVMEAWCYHDSPATAAYRYLESLDLGPQFEGADAVGEVKLVWSSAPGSDYLGAEVYDEVSLSLLQNRLNELNTGIQIVMM